MLMSPFLTVAVALAVFAYNPSGGSSMVIVVINFDAKPLPGFDSNSSSSYPIIVRF